ncbi:hypothetical protein SAMN05216559_1813 [Halomicrobium zhouii]|uniref:Uncharacterized protein n=1 Tax=Halomicrobium zhouii TaxID=767519 RepID=A0A1I6L198_9EURY|nr:hypothetical protein SAMN05216559_1813 [Halomicrobium zhouii]
MQELSRCTDVTFKEPPDTAATWTRSDFTDLSPGDRSTSVHPPDAELTDNQSIVDAHASLFAVQPSTRLHREPGDATLYVAPEGTVRGLVDYRVRLPGNRSVGNRSVEWGVADQGVTEVRLLAGDDVVARADGSQTPVVDYALEDSGSTTLTLEADIEVQLQGEASVGEGSAERSGSIARTDTVTVTDSIDVSVYDLGAYSYEATYPNGDTGLAIHQTAPWHGFALGGDDDGRVRGVWRYYTARDTGWDVLNASSAGGTTQRASEALPVYVHAYPAHVGPRAEPIRDGPTLVDTWGTGHGSPAPSMHENVTVGVVDGPYNRTDGLAVRHEDIDADDIVVSGIVRNVTARPSTFVGQETRTIRRSNLTIERIDTDGDSATLRIELRDETTGAPIVLDNPILEERSATPIGVQPRDGYITVANQRVRTNTSGVAVVTVDEPGSYTATYEPESWRANDPAYVGDSDSVSWHPLWELSEWLRLLYHGAVALAPFLVALYAGYRISAFLQIDQHP